MSEPFLRTQSRECRYDILKSYDRIGQECGQPCLTDEEVQEILRKNTRARRTVYGTDYAIRFTHKQMVPTPVMLAETPGNIAQSDLSEHNPFASRSMVTSNATLPKQGQAVYRAGADPTRAADTLLRDPRRVRQGVLEALVCSKTDPAQSPRKEPSMTTLQRTEVGVPSGNLYQRR